mmetsp:Transcript_26565/g.60644  ORF Transcript_26565/g.60644 Transcript_26565/m.60644 type:complete len:223 (-) Transcript_26565:380-1048(-)
MQPSARLISIRVACAAKVFKLKCLPRMISRQTVGTRITFPFVVPTRRVRVIDATSLAPKHQFAINHGSSAVAAESTSRLRIAPWGLISPSGLPLISALTFRLFKALAKALGSIRRYALLVEEIADLLLPRSRKAIILALFVPSPRRFPIVIIIISPASEGVESSICRLLALSNEFAGCDHVIVQLLRKLENLNALVIVLSGNRTGLGPEDLLFERVSRHVVR